MTDKAREEFETSPRFKGMDFARSVTHPEYYESPYANGAWDGWQASREAVEIDLQKIIGSLAYSCDFNAATEAIEAAGLKVKP